MILRIFLLALILTFMPINSAAGPSYQIDNSITLSPAYSYILAEESDEWPEVLTQLPYFRDYELIEAIKVNVDAPCEWLKVNLIYSLTAEQEPFVLIINNDNEISKQEIVFDDDNQAYINLINYDIGEYWFCFYVQI